MRSEIFSGRFLSAQPDVIAKPRQWACIVFRYRNLYTKRAEHPR